MTVSPDCALVSALLIVDMPFDGTVMVAAAKISVERVKIRAAGRYENRGVCCIVISPGDVWRRGLTACRVVIRLNDDSCLFLMVQDVPDCIYSL